MKILVIILFLIFLLTLLSKFEIDIRKIEYKNKKIKIEAYFKIYILKILILKIKIHKKTIIKLLSNLLKKERKERKENKSTIQSKIEDIQIIIIYGLKNAIINSYIYAGLNFLIPTLIEKTKINQTTYHIKTNFEKTYFYINISLKIKIQHIKTIVNFIN